MLKIYEFLFQELSSLEINYCVYKGLNHLSNDLEGARGDVDILTSKTSLSSFLDIALKAGFKFNKVNEDHFYLFGLDLDTHKMAMIDLSTNIFSGDKRFKPLVLSLDVEKLSIDYREVNTLSMVDYIPLIFLIRLMSKGEITKDLDEVKRYLLNQYLRDVEAGYIQSQVEGSIASWEEIISSIIVAKDWDELRQKYAFKAKSLFKVNKLRLVKSKFKHITKAIRMLRRNLFFPPYRVNKKGHLIAFLGVDGSGKSSAVGYIMNLPYFKATGVKRMYFGSNEYWLPGLSFLLAKSVNWPKNLRVFVGTLVLIDRQLRSLGACYHLSIGNTVLADRYIYDDLISRKVNIDNNSKPDGLLKQLYRSIFRLRMLIQPDMVIFMDVSPEVAYSRKQDFSYDHMLKINKAYKQYMYSVSNVEVIDCDQKHEIVLNDIAARIVKKFGFNETNTKLGNK